MKRKQRYLRKIEGTPFAVHNLNGWPWAYAAGVPVMPLPRVGQWRVFEEWRKLSGYKEPR